jgi:regulator of protease activity HflC (stomatin/prohibitin superfamily)
MLIPWVYFIKEDEQLLIENPTRRWTHNGPGSYTALPFERVSRRKGVTLGPTDYLHVRDKVTGEVHTEYGPKLFFPLASEELSVVMKAIPLKNNQYVRLLDKRTGVLRVERGEKSVYLSPTEDVLDDVKTGINIDEHTAVLARDTTSGQLTLITEPQVLIPAPNQEIVEARRRILLEDHEAVVIKDKAGQYTVRRGTDAERAFFLQPYTQLVQFFWSTGVNKEARTLKFTHLDMRPKFMWYEFTARTRDNVELTIGITIFWQIVDVAAMIRSTDDTPGDVCSHARSTILQAVSKVTLEEFLAGFNTLVKQAVLESTDSFYGERGVKLHAVEVRSVACKDSATQSILMDIIQETTNRLNRLQKQESENEVRLKQINGEIEAEEARRRLLELLREHKRAEGQMQGQAEADQVQAFLAGLSDDLPLMEKVALFNSLRKREALEALSAGNASLYFTPADVDLTIETRRN